MKCLKCNRRVKNNDMSKMKHIWMYHGEEIIVRTVPWLFSEEALNAIGRFFGAYVKNQIQSRVR